MKRLRKIAVVIISLLVVLYLGLVIVALLPQETIPISTLSGPQDKFIMVNGQTIHYLKQGNGKHFWSTVLPVRPTPGAS